MINTNSDDNNIEVLDDFESITSIDDEKKIPLTHIKRMRKKDAKRRKVFKIISSVICFVLVFAIGFASGRYYSENILNPGTKKAGTSASGDKNITSDSANGKDTNNDSTMSNANSDNPPAPSQEDKMLEGLKTKFVNRLKAISPEMIFSFGIKNLRTGKSIDYNNIKINSAGVINLFIMETLYKEIADGNYTITPEKEEALAKMITNDDIDASAMFIDEFGQSDPTGQVSEKNTINTVIRRNKYKQTELNGKLYAQTPPEGYTAFNNYTGVGDVIKLLEGIYNKSLFEEPYNTKALELLKAQTKRDKIPAKITQTYPDVTIANKSGDLLQVENDAALIMCKDFDLAFVVFVEDIPLKEDGGLNEELHTQIRQVISELGLDLVISYKTNKF
ncbi:MAG: serine hydrolase [Clostridia bacterium]|nr:serine hydrolase [Clostridia bacterium]